MDNPIKENGELNRLEALEKPSLASIKNSGKSSEVLLIDTNNNSKNHNNNNIYSDISSSAAVSSNSQSKNIKIPSLNKIEETVCNFTLCTIHSSSLTVEDKDRLSYFGDRFTCKGFYDHPLVGGNNTNKDILNLFLYTNKLLYINAQNYYKQITQEWDVVKHLGKRIYNHEHNVDGYNKEDKLDHDYCDVILTVSDKNMIIGVLELFIHKFTKKPEIFTALSVIRLFNKLIDLSSQVSLMEECIENEFNANFYINLFNVYNYIYLSYLKVPILRESVKCYTGGRICKNNVCLFQQEYTREDLALSVSCMKYLIEKRRTQNVRICSIFKCLMDIHSLLNKINQQVEVLDYENFYLNIHTKKGVSNIQRIRNYPNPHPPQQMGEIEDSTIRRNHSHINSQSSLNAEVYAEEGKDEIINSESVSRTIEEEEEEMTTNFSNRQLTEEFRAYKCKVFSLCDYVYSMPLNVKADFLKLSNFASHRLCIQDCFFKALFEGHNDPYLSLTVRRSHLYEDTVSQLLEVDPSVCRKQLKIHFQGEEGVDGGGIKKDFFQLLAAEISNDKTIFVSIDGGNSLWFKKNGDLKKLRLVGLLMGIALYNDALLDIKCNSLIFKKILNMDTSFEDLKMYDRDIYNSFKSMENMREEDFREMDLDFIIPASSGSRNTNGEIYYEEDIKVTIENYSEYVEIYTDYLLNKAMLEEFNEFLDGFYSVISEFTLINFNYREVEGIVLGSPFIDFEVIKEFTQYEGFSLDSSDRIIREFWEIILEEFSIDEDRKRKLLRFVTGNDKLPIGGPQSLGIKIINNGADTNRLPSAHTCFNCLLLPIYSNKGKLREKLVKAIEMTEGFYLQ